jgi:hypothetical protein
VRPERFRYEMNRAFDIWFDEHSVREFDRLLPYIKRMWSKWAREEDDFRTGVETYGYDSNDGILSNMFYISDRYRCAFRLKWIIDGVESGKISSSVFVNEQCAILAKENN